MSKPETEKRKAARSRTRAAKRPGVFRSTLVSGAVMVACAFGVHFSRGSIATDYDEVGTVSDVYAIPGKEQLLVFSLGYRAAMADLLFGRTMVAAGVHFSEKRVFHHLDSYLHGIIALDPGYYDVYRYADTLLNLSTVEMPKENLRKAREIQEMGLEQFPQDAELWMTTGQFIAYLAPNRMTDPKEKAEWRAAGARILSHACDIWPSRDDLPEVCLSSATLLSEAGQQEAAILAMRKLIAVADDEEIRRKAMNRLSQLTNERAARKSRQTLERLDNLRMGDLPAADRMTYQLLSPPKEVRRCVGLHAPADDPRCASSFAHRGELYREGFQDD